MPPDGDAPASVPVTRATRVAVGPTRHARDAEWVPVTHSTAAPDDYRPGVLSIFFTLMLVADLVFLGLAAIAQTIIGLRVVFGGEQVTYGTATAGELWAAQGLMFVFLGLIPLLWVLATRQRPLAGTLEYLGLKRWGHASFVGVGLAGFMVAAVLLMTAILALLPESWEAALGEGGQGDDSYFSLFNTLTWPLAVFIALTAGVGEEILFRGILQRWVGIWGQAVLFVMAHMANAFPLQWAVAFSVAVVFGCLRRAGWSLVTLIVAHVVYDFVLLGLFLLLGP